MKVETGLLVSKICKVWIKGKIGQSCNTNSIIYISWPRKMGKMHIISINFKIGAPVLCRASPGKSIPLQNYLSPIILCHTSPPVQTQSPAETWFCTETTWLRATSTPQSLPLLYPIQSWCSSTSEILRLSQVSLILASSNVNLYF